MKNTKNDESLYKLLFCSNTPFSDVLENVPLSEIDVEEVYEWSKTFLEFYYGEFCGKCNIEGFPLIQTKEYLYIIPAIKCLTTSMSIHPFLTLLYFKTLTIALYAWQILFEIKNDNIYPVKIRINEQVKGKFTGNCSLSLSKKRFSVKRFIPKTFEPELDEISPYHITVIYNFENLNEVCVYYNVIIQGVNINNDSMLNENLMSEKQFIDYCNKNNLSISSRTLYMYRNLAIFPEPYQLKVKGKKANYYNPTWIKFIKFISDEKKKHGNPWVIKNLRENNKDFFENIPIKKK